MNAIIGPGEQRLRQRGTERRGEARLRSRGLSVFSGVALGGTLQLRLTGLIAGGATGGAAGVNSALCITRGALLTGSSTRAIGGGGLTDAPR